MKNIHSFSRQRLVLAGSAIALLSVIAIVPWRLVAQDRNQTNRATASKTNTAGNNVAPGKLIVGTWIAAATNGELTVRDDGTYLEFSRFVNGTVSAPSGFVNEHGSWKINNQVIALMPDRQVPALRGSPIRKVSQPQAGAAQPAAGLPMGPDEGAQSNETAADQRREFSVVRLDDSFLRITPVVPPGSFGGDTGTQFYRRDKEKSVPQQFDAAIPGELKQLAELAQLTPKEALSLVDWFKARHLKDMQLAIVGKIAAARRGKVDFQQLFGLSDVEEQSLADLLKLAGTFNSACSLAEIGQLAPDELSAVTKLRQFKSELSEIRSAVDTEVVPPAGGGQPDKLIALSKLKAYLDELALYIDWTVFQQDGPASDSGIVGGNNPAGGGVF